MERRQFGPDDIRRLKDAAERVLGERPDVVAAYLYGSAARGEPARDLDVALLFHGKVPSARELEHLASELQRMGAPHGPEIDLRAFNRTAPRFRANVIDEGQLLVDRDAAKRVELEGQALNEWLDFKPVWERMQRRMRERWTRG